jgi:hypothetical protein
VLEATENSLVTRAYERLRDLAKKIQKLDETFRFTIDQI